MNRTVWHRNAGAYKTADVVAQLLLWRFPEDVLLPYMCADTYAHTDFHSGVYKIAILFLGHQQKTRAAPENSRVSCCRHVYSGEVPSKIPTERLGYYYLPRQVCTRRALNMQQLPRFPSPYHVTSKADPT